MDLIKVSISIGYNDPDVIFMHKNMNSWYYRSTVSLHFEWQSFRSNWQETQQMTAIPRCSYLILTLFWGEKDTNNCDHMFYRFTFWQNHHIHSYLWQLCHLELTYNNFNLTKFFFLFSVFFPQMLGQHIMKTMLVVGWMKVK